MSGNKITFGCPYSLVSLLRSCPQLLKGKVMRKLPVILLSAVATIAIVGGVMASSSGGTCNYREDGKYVMSDGTVSAFGTMNHAMHCASLGLLPDVVSRRLGWLGSEETKAWAEDIKRLNQEVRERNQKEAEEALEPISEPIKVEVLDAPDEGV